MVQEMYSDETTGILAMADVDFEENLTVAGNNDYENHESNCDNYGCSCISHENCCGCYAM